MDTKYCRGCRSNLEVEKFGVNLCKRDNLQSLCKICDSQYHADWYVTNKEKQKARIKDNKRKKTEWLESYKKTLKCAECSENRWFVLEFHHTDPSQKEFPIAHMNAKGASIKRTLKEIAKCEVLCANCHRARHYNEKIGS
jgi:hypothetical protein